MSRSLPYVQRRGDTLFFRMAVPLDLRPQIGGREITKTLQTTDRRVAAPRALLLASRVLKVFAELRTMPKDDEGLRTNYVMEFSFDELGLPKLKFSDVKPGDEKAIIELTRELGATPTTKLASPPGQAVSPKLSAVIKHFLQDQGTRGIKEMMKKHELVMPLVLDVVGDKPIADLRQADLLDLFDVINRLPKHSSYDFAKGKSYREIAAIPDRERLGKAIGLFTGARVNEICQINPQTDIQQDADTGIWYFLMTDETEGDDRIEKTIKTKTTRQTPIHSTLLDLGFLDYVRRLDPQSKLLFPQWKPKGGRASPYAAEFFTEFLKQIGLHGVKNVKGFAPRGMHALRHTLLTYGYSQQGHALFCISGHVEGSEFANKVGAGYIDYEIARSLAYKKDLLEKLSYPVGFHKPVITVS